MSMLDRKLLRDLMHMRGQVATIALVVACGVAAFVAAVSTYDSLNRSQRSYYETSRFADVFAGLKRAPGWLGARIAAIPGIARSETRIVFDVTLDVPGQETPLVGRMIALPEQGAPLLNRLHLRRGRLLESADRDAVLVNEAFATANGLGPGSRLHAILNGKLQELHIVGIVLSPEYVFASPAGDAIPDDRRFGVFWMSHDPLAAAFDMEGAFNDVTATLAPGASASAVIDALDRLLEPYGGLGAYTRDEQPSNRFVADELREQRTIATTIPAIFLGVAAFLLNAVFGRLLAAQREQLASLKAMGYSNGAVAVHYVKFAAVIVLAGTALGVVIGAWLGYGMAATYTLFFRFPELAYRMQPWLPLVAGGVSLAAAAGGILGALRRIVALAPAEAMRPPAPTVFHHGVLGRMAILQKASPRLRMLLRGLGSRPLRTASTVLGIAAAVPIVIIGLFWSDAIDYLVAVQFGRVERGDAVVTFVDPVEQRSLREIAHLPGVMQVEGQRIVPVEFVAGHHSYRTAIIGLPPDAMLRRLLDVDLRPVPIEPGGLVMNDRLAERLAVRAGARIEIQVLEGERRRLEMPITALVNEMVGLTAYMDIATLNRLMREDDLVNAASLVIDPALSSQLHAELKRLPQVRTVTIKAASIAMFRETTAKFILVFATILAAFGAVIAVGVVYNNARIALQERAWELATLRVLGFSRAEVSRLLFAELAVAVCIAVPLGLVLSYLTVLAMVGWFSSEMFQIPLVIAPRTYAVGAATVVLAALASAWLVRRRIDRLDLVAVLKVRE